MKEVLINKDDDEIVVETSPDELRQIAATLENVAGDAPTVSIIWYAKKGRYAMRFNHKKKQDGRDAVQ
jgi:hypothetical protein